MKGLLDNLAKCCKENDYSIYRIAVLNGENEETEQINIRNMNACMNSYSVAKVFTMTAIGLLVDDNLLSVDEKITNILAEEYANVADERWHNVTVEMALTHKIGLQAGFLDIDAKDPLTFGEDYLTYTLQQSLNFEPGTESVYTDAAYYLLARVVEKRANMPLDTFLWKRLFAPLSFREVAWSRCPQGHVKLYETIASLTCNRVEDLAQAMEIFPEMTFHYDGIVSEESLETISKIVPKNRLTVWLPYQNRFTSWFKGAFVDDKLASLVKKYARLGIWLISEDEELEAAESFGAELVETNGHLKPL